jgi:hypothetical protein
MALQVSIFGRNRTQSYTVVVLRYVHDVIAGEFLNVGVLLCTKSADEVLVLFKTEKSSVRAKAVFSNFDVEAFQAMLTGADNAVRGISNELEMTSGDLDAQTLAQRALPRDDSALQWAPSQMSGLTEDATETFHRLYRRHVTQYETERLLAI